MPEGLNYQEDEWDLLAALPQSVAAALMVAHSGGLMRETMAMMEAVDLAREKFSDSSLVQTVLAGIQRGETDPDDGDGDAAAPPGMEYDAVAQSRQAAILLQRAPAREAEAYRQFVYFFADRIAGSTKEGGFLGFGGKRISAKEEEIISAVDTALREQRGEPNDRDR